MESVRENHNRFPCKSEQEESFGRKNPLTGGKDCLTSLAFAYGLTSLVSSFWLNPYGEFLSTVQTGSWGLVLQAGLFFASAITIHLLLGKFLSLNRKWLVLIFVQFYLAIMSWRSCGTAFAAGALLVALPLAIFVHGELNQSGDPRKPCPWRILNYTAAGLSLLSFFRNWTMFGGLIEDSSGPFIQKAMMTRLDVASWVIGGTAVVTTLILYQMIVYKRKKLRLTAWPGFTAIALSLSLLPSFYLALILVARVRGFGVSTFDMGVFTQMFHSMRRTGVPLTTLERDTLMSHFKVHLSPIYYAMLPVFAIFPKAETLQVLQVLVVVSGILPLWLLTRKLLPGSRGKGLFVLSIYLLQPAMLGSSLYDLHENCFLAPLLLWLLYFGREKKGPGMLVFTLLTLMVKEDAGLYVITIALYLMISGANTKGEAGGKRDRNRAIAMILISLIHFSGSVLFLSRLGDGVMVDRFKNLIIYSSLGYGGIVLSALQNPGYYLATMWTPDKLNYMLAVLSSLGFLPVFQKRIGNLVHFIPFIVMNLLSSYGYQYQLAFQYHYGSGVLLIFLVLLALADRDPDMGMAPARPSSLKLAVNRPMSRALACAIAFAVAMGISQGYYLLRDRRHYVKRLKTNKEVYEAIESGLNQIPHDAAVGATTYLTTYLASRELVYDLDFHKAPLDDGHLPWLAFDGRTLSDDLQELFQDCIDYGYLISDFSNEGVTILVWPACLSDKANAKPEGDFAILKFDTFSNDAR